MPRQILIWTMAALLAGRVHGNANDKGPREYWSDDSRQEAVTRAVQMIAEPNPFVMAGLRVQAKKDLVWREYDLALGAPPLDPHRLRLIKDRSGMPNFTGVDPLSRSPEDKAAFD